MTVIDRSAVQVALPALVVEMRPAGLVVPRYRLAPEITLDLAGLRTIAALASGNVAPGDVDTPEALELRAQLEQRSLIGAAPASETQDPVVVPRHPTTASLEDGLLVLPTPVLFGVGRSGFEVVDHDGRLLVLLSAEELWVASVFRSPQSLASAYEAHREAADAADVLDAGDFETLVRVLVGTGTLVPFDLDDPVLARQTRQAERMREAIRRSMFVHREFDRIDAEHDARGGLSGRIPVVAFHTNHAGPPQALGLLMATAKAHDGGALERTYDFRPRMMWDRTRFEDMARRGPGIYLFSNYTWSSTENLAYSALLKEIEPRSVTIHGGPDTPKYPGDVEQFFADHPDVDVCVHGEGEATFVHLLEVLDGRIGSVDDLAVLAEVPGLSYRTAAGPVQTESRDRIAELDALPSPILTGWFDGFIPAGGGEAGIIIETNRGCPYGCTFCDWGSATTSRIRKFATERVFAELEWSAVNGFGVGIADANFGMFERDVDIARHVTALKARYGFPRAVGNNYAKNTVKHLSKIIDIFTEAGIVAEGKMSMQSLDEPTLLTIRRKNIKVEKYSDLAVEFRRNNLPMVVELMIGLPGATPASFRNDLQACIDRDVRSIVHTTVLLPNSPMNAPEYRRENGIVARPGEILTETSSYTRAEYDDMQQIRRAFYVFENFGVLRQVGLYVRSKTSVRQIDFYDQVVADVLATPERWPTLAVAIDVLPSVMVPPVSWGRFIDDVRRYVVDQAGLADDSELDTVLRVQHAASHTADRVFPLTVELPHDYAAWHAAVADARSTGVLEHWPTRAPSLADFGPAAFTVDDPLDSCGRALGFPCDSFFYFDNAWDLESPVSRPRQAQSEDGLAASAVV